jgi:deazaflavin-dependent oxidoreductase (nitroreductase family)
LRAGAKLTRNTRKSPPQAGYGRNPGAVLAFPWRLFAPSRPIVDGGNEMAEKFMAALRNSDQIGITVTGRTTGLEITVPVWFVEGDGKLYLLPVNGAGSDWYKNVRATPRMQLTADGESIAVTATPVTEPDRVRTIVEKFRGTYGADQIASYYPKTDVAVEVSLPKESA